MSGEEQQKPPVYYQWGDGPLMRAPESPPPPPPPAQPPREVVGKSLALIQREGFDPLLPTPEATAAGYAALVNRGMGVRESALRFWWPDNPDLSVHIALMGGISHRIPEVFGVPLPSLLPPEQRAMVEQQLAGPLYRQHFIVVAEAVLRGFVEVTGVYPRLSMQPMQLDADTVCEGRLDLARETLTDYRTGHEERYWSLHVRATASGLETYNGRDMAATRRDVFSRSVLSGDHVMEGNTIHILRSKRAVWGELSKANPGLFGSWETFKRRYAPSGSWAGDLRKPIIWSRDNNLKEDD
jgi:hypothetical protein